MHFISPSSLIIKLIYLFFLAWCLHVSASAWKISHPQVRLWRLHSTRFGGIYSCLLSDFDDFHRFNFYEQSNAIYSFWYGWWMPWPQISTLHYHAQLKPARNVVQSKEFLDEYIEQDKKQRRFLSTCIVEQRNFPPPLKFFLGGGIVFFRAGSLNV